MPFAGITAFNLAIRDFITNGVPASGKHKPVRTDMRSALNQLDTEIVASFGAEATDRAAADTTINNALTAEITARGVSEGLAKKNLFSSTGGLSGTISEPATSVRPPRWLFDPTTNFRLPADSPMYWLPVYGQSNALTSTSGSVVAATAIYPSRALMPSDAYGSGRLRPYEDGFSEIRPLVEGGPNASVPATPETGAYTLTPLESVASSMLNHMIQRLDVALPGNDVQFGSFVCANGSTAYAHLQPGSKPYRWLIKGVESAVAIARARGKRVVVPAIPFIHGETDSNTADAGRYRTFLRHLQRSVDRDIRSITGQEERVALVVMQSAYTHVPAQPFGQLLQREQLAASDDADIVLAGPAYQYQRNYASTSVERIHMSCIGQNRAGQALARAALAHCFGQGWQPVKPIRVYFESTTVMIVEVYAPVEPIVIDAAADVTMTNSPTVSGFEVTDPAGNYLAISSVVVRQASTSWTPPKLAITLSSAPSVGQVRLMYAQRRDGEVCTMTIATPGVVTLTAHGIAAGWAIVFSTTGALPTGVTAGKIYYVIATGLTANAFQFSLTVGGSAVATSGSQSGVHRVASDTGLGFGDGPTFGARGSVRDSESHVSLYNGSLGSLNGIADKNWLVSFDMMVPV